MGHFENTAMMHSMIQNWLDGQCRGINGIGGGLVLMFVPNQGALSQAAVWPVGAVTDQRLVVAAQTAFNRQQAVIGAQSDVDQTPAKNSVVSHPLRSGGQTVGAVALSVERSRGGDSKAVLKDMMRGIAAFDALLERRDPARPGATGRVLELIGTALSHESCKDAATAVATEMATMLNCDRVSIGFRASRYATLEALSQAVDFKTEQGLIRLIAAAIDESIDQAATVIYPPSETSRPQIVQAHGELAQRGNPAICTIPMVQSGKVLGAICLERSGEQGFPTEVVSLSEDVAALIGPVLELKRVHDQPLRKKFAAGLRRKIFGSEGQRGLVVKLFALGAVALLGALAFVPVEYRITATARVEGAVQRMLVAPTDGYLKAALVHPGDVVKKDQLLAVLAEDELKIEQRRWQSEVAQAQNAYGEALAKQDRAAMVMSKAKIDEAQAQLSLVEEKLQRTEIRAPFDGVVIKGDLSQSLSAPVKRGEMLMAMAPKDEYRVILEIDERDIGEISIGQRGHLAVAALPQDPLPISISRVTPVADTVEGRHFFEVEAKLTQAAERLRPGLNGVAKIEVEQRSLLWIWTHRATNWLRMAFWSWLG